MRGSRKRYGDGVLWMLDARASVARVSDANGARNPGNKGENMPHGQNAISGSIGQFPRYPRKTDNPLAAPIETSCLFLWDHEIDISRLLRLVLFS